MGALALLLQGPGRPSWTGGHVPVEGFLELSPVRPGLRLQPLLRVAQGGGLALDVREAASLLPGGQPFGGVWAGVRAWGGASEAS